MGQMTLKKTSEDAGRDFPDCSQSKPYEPPEVSIQFSAARFLLKTGEERKITQAAVDGIVHDVTGLWDMAMKKVGVIFVAFCILFLEHRLVNSAL